MRTFAEAERDAVERGVAQKKARHKSCRGVRRTRDKIVRGDGAGGALYDNVILGTARHIRCDRCLRKYLPQHVHRMRKWYWQCGNCTTELGGGVPLDFWPRYLLRRPWPRVA